MLRRGWCGVRGVRRIALVVAACAVLALGLVLAAPGASTAWAHAAFLSAEPAPNSASESAPARVSIEFSEPLAAAFSTIEVLDSTGRRVDRGDSAVDPRDATRLTVSLEPLTNGTYTVAWRNVSTVDGHALRGSYVFSVGAPGNAPARPGDDDEMPLFYSRAEPVVRWLALLGALVLVGALGFEWTVLRPALGALAARRPRARDSANRLDEMERRAVRLISRLAWAALAVLTLASLAHLLVQAASAADVPPHRVPPEALRSVLGDTSWGRAWTGRMALLALVALTLRAGGRGQSAGRGRLPSLAVALAALLPLSLASHAAATTGLAGPAVFTDYLHLVAAALWVGGLAALLPTMVMARRTLAEAERARFLPPLVSRFSALAALSVGTLVITGLYSSWLQVTIPRAIDTPYGWALLAKVALVAGLAALGGVNLLWLRPRLAAGGGAARWLRRTVAAEIVLGVLVVLVAGVLTSLEPARQTQGREDARAGVSVTETVEGTTIETRVQPAAVGPNRVEVALSDRHGDAVADASHVGVALRYLGADLAPETSKARHVGAGIYVVDGALLNIAGPWQVEVEVRQPDAFDARAAFRFDTAGAAASATVAPATAAGRLLWAWQLVALGGLALVVSRGSWRGTSGGRWITRGGAALALIGVVLVVGVGHFHSPARGAGVDVPEVNPIPPTADSVAIGRELYSTHCQGCHGVDARGDGPDAEGLQPPPADLRLHVPMHGDRSVFGFISAGLPATAMPAFGDTLTDEQIWHLLNYLRSLESGEAER